MTVPLLRYTVLRLALFVACLGVFGVLGLGGWVLLLVSAGVSLALSFLLLRRQREALARALVARTERRLTRGPHGIAADTLAEDAEDDARRAAEASGDRPQDPGRGEGSVDRQADRQQ